MYVSTMLNNTLCVFIYAYCEIKTASFDHRRLNRLVERQNETKHKNSTKRKENDNNFRAKLKISHDIIIIFENGKILRQIIFGHFSVILFRMHSIYLTTILN